jgi:hypothetical protein
MGTRATLARLLSQERITGSDQEIALAHEFNRQNTVKQVFVHLFLMAKFGFLPGPLTVEKAENQYLYAHGDDQAAHCVPGQMVLGTQAVQKLITASEDLQLIVENLFANTDEIHSRFNKADSRAEENGLRAAFGDACNFIVRVGRYARFNRAVQFYPYIDEAFSQYKMNGIPAFDQAIAIQRTKIAEPLVGVTREELIAILEWYRWQLETSIISLETVQGLYAEDLWRDYRAMVP